MKEVNLCWGDKGDKQDWKGEKGEGQEERGWSRENVQ